MSKALRKGVHSCQECRRRKVRCTFRREYGSTCTGCYSRRLPCVDQSQDPSSRVAADNRLSVRERLTHLEEQMMSILGEQSPGETTRSSVTNSSDLSVGFNLGNERQSRTTNSQSSNNPAGYHLNAPILSLFGTEALNSGEEVQDHPGNQSVSHTDDSESHLRSLKIRQTILSLVPQPEDLRLILRGREEWWNTWRRMFPAGLDVPNHATFLEHVVWGIGHSNLAQAAISLICIASSIQQLDPTNLSLIQRLPRPPRELISRYVEIVDNFIINDTSLVSSYEGMEVMVLHGKLNVDIGHPRKTWIIYHRAIALAQLMGWNHKGKIKSSETDRDVQRRLKIWSLLEQADRLMSLVLGLPCAVADNPYSVANSAINWDSPTLTSDYRSVLSQIACQVISRNQVDSDLPFSFSADIDNRLTSLENSMPPAWWNPNSAANLSDEEYNERLMTQFWNQQIRVFLHLPYAIKSITGNQYDQSRISCLEASRELSRTYHLLRSRDGAAFWLSKIIDHLGFIAAVLLLLRLRGYWKNLDAGMKDEKQDSADWELVRITTDHLRRVAREFAGASAEQAVQVIDHLLAAGGGCHGTKNAGQQKEVKKVFIPYFGTVAISGMGLCSHRRSLEGAADRQTRETMTGVVESQAGPILEPAAATSPCPQISLSQKASSELRTTMPDLLLPGPIDVEVDWFSSVMQQDLEQDWNWAFAQEMAY